MDYSNEIDRHFLQYEAVRTKAASEIALVDRYPFADLVIEREFQKADDSLEQVYAKIVLLNEMYSTRIFGTFEVALNIWKVKDFRERVCQGDPDLVEEIRGQSIGGKSRDLYSFATKYCHNHNPAGYPIFDNLVCRRLCEELARTGVRIVRRRLRNYQYFKAAVDKLAELWKIRPDQKYRKLDRYLWRQE